MMTSYVKYKFHFLYAAFHNFLFKKKLCPNSEKRFDLIDQTGSNKWNHKRKIIEDVARNHVFPCYFCCQFKIFYDAENIRNRLTKTASESEMNFTRTTNKRKLRKREKCGLQNILNSIQNSRPVHLDLDPHCALLNRNEGEYIIFIERNDNGTRTPEHFLYFLVCVIFEPTGNKMNCTITQFFMECV